MSQFGEFSQGQGQSYGLREVTATREIRYRNSTGLLIALAMFMALSVGLVTFIVMDRIQEARAQATAKANASAEIETMKAVATSTKGSVTQTQYGKFFLLKSGDLYYLPNSGVKFADDALPGEAGRYVIEKDDIDNFELPTSVVGGKPMTTSYVFDGYQIKFDSKVAEIKELDTMDVVGSRGFKITTDTGRNYLLMVTLGNVQRKLVYDEVEQIIYTEVTEEKTESETEKTPIAQDSEEAEDLAEEELKEAQQKVLEPTKVIKKVPRIETSVGEARAQLIEL